MIRPPLHARGGILPWVVAGNLLLAAMLTGGALGYWLFLNLRVGLTVSEQPLALQLPHSVRVDAAVTNRLDIGLDGVINASVPVDEKVIVPMRGEYQLDVSIDARVPVDFTINYNGLLPVDTYADIRARTDLDFRTIKQYRNLAIEARLPLKMKIPVNLEVPVEQTIRFRYDGPLTVTANQNLATRLDTVLDTRLPVDQTVSTPVTGEFGLDLQLPRGPVKAIINHGALDLEPRTLRLERTGDPDRPRRQSSPYGPAAEPDAR